MMPLSSLKQQRGAILIVALIMLTLVTLIGVSSFNMVKIDLQVAHNAEVRAQAASFAQVAIDDVISSGDFWKAAASTRKYFNGVTVGDVEVVVSKARCISARTHPNPGRQNLTSRPAGSDLMEVIWEVRAVARDLSTGSESVVRQGVSKAVLLRDWDEVEAECKK